VVLVKHIANEQLKSRLVFNLSYLKKYIKSDYYYKHKEKM